jgi:hypothetical protein
VLPSTLQPTALSQALYQFNDLNHNGSQTSLTPFYERWEAIQCMPSTSGAT